MLLQTLLKTRLSHAVRLGCASVLVFLFLLACFPPRVSATKQKSRDSATKGPSDYLVTGLEDIEPSFDSFDGSMYAGMVPFTSYDGSSAAEYMFWMFEPEEALVKDSLVIWLNGGPGCTSFNAGLLFETAPVTTGPLKPGSCCIEPNAPLRPNHYAWTKSTIMLYVEQPAGTGFSHGPQPHNEEDLSKDFHSFLLNFLTIFDHLAHHKIYFFGESYAGMYVPSIARWIHVQNKKKNSVFHINLAGIGLGNGLIDVTQQTEPMIDYAYYHGLIDSTQRKNIVLEWERCYAPGHEEDYQEEPKPYHSFNVPDECGIMAAIALAAGGTQIPGKVFNPYDVSTFDPYASLSHVKNESLQDSTNTRFFNDIRVKKALHAPEKTLWMGCIPGSGRRRRTMEIPKEYYPVEPLLEQDRPISMAPYIAELLDDAKIDVLVYNGDRDMACCAQGSEAVLDNLEWNGAGEWKQAERFLWLVKDEMAGYVKSSGNLTFAICFNSGHMFPTNQPENALDLVTRFIRRQSFADVKTPDFADYDPNSLVGDGEEHQITTAAPQFVRRFGGFWVQHILDLLVGFVAGIGIGFGLARRNIPQNEYISIPDVELEPSH